MSTKTLKISEESKKDLDALCEFHQLNIGEAVEAMITYFKSTGHNPTNEKSLFDELSQVVKNEENQLKESILKAIREAKAQEIATRANELFKMLKTDLESQKKGLLYASVSVEEVFKTYQKRFNALEKENSTLTKLLNM